MKKLIFIFIALSFILIGCSSIKESQSIQNQKYKPDLTHDVINIHGKITNFDKFDRFFTNTTIGKTDRIRVISYTIEGEPIIYDFSYDSKSLKLISDNSYDKFGPRNKGKKETIWAGIDKEHKEDYTEYYLYQVSGKPQAISNQQGNNLNFKTNERMPILMLKDSLNKTGQTAIILENTIIKEQPSVNSKALSTKLLTGNLIKVLDDKGQGWYYIEPVTFSYPPEKGYIQDKNFSFDISKATLNQGFISKKKIYSEPNSNIINQEYAGPVRIITKKNGWVYCSFPAGIDNAWVKENDIEYIFPK